MYSPKRIFFDSSVLISAASSPEGSSACLLQFAAEGKIRLMVTRRVLDEAKVNIVDLLGQPLWAWFTRTIGSLRLSLTDSPTKTEKIEWSQVPCVKDAHILAGAIKSKADVLVSLDRQILNPSIQKAFPLPIMSPNDFLQKFSLSQRTAARHRC